MWRALLFGCFAFLVGCQGVPVQLALPPNPKPQPAIVLFEEIEPNREAVKQAVLRHLPPGTPVERAQAMLQEQGFTCREYNSWTWFFNQCQLIPPEVHLTSTEQHRIYEQRAQKPVFCQANLKANGEWHLTAYRVLVVLIPDGAGALHDVEVGIGQLRHMNAEFFKQRPELHDPVGLPIEEARTRLVDAGFYCMGIAQRAEKDDRPFMLLVAFDEGLLGGQVVRVHLYSDAAGVVRETEVLAESGAFDAEWCMLPHGDESPTWLVCKAALFPTRVACRWTLITGCVCLAMAAQGPVHGLKH
jgi:hypothetical protein